MLSNIKVILKRIASTSRPETELNTSIYTKHIEEASNYSSFSTETTTSTSPTIISEFHFNSTNLNPTSIRSDEHLNNTSDLDYLIDPLESMEDHKSNYDLFQILQMNNMTFLTDLLENSKRQSIKVLQESATDDKSELDTHQEIEFENNFDVETFIENIPHFTPLNLKHLLSHLS